jgi:hypothetical protein
VYVDTDSEVLHLKELVNILHEGPINSFVQNAIADRLLQVCRDIKGKTIMGSLPSASILFNLTSLLEDQKIKYALIGGLAVNVHGQARGTEDIDVLVSKLPQQTSDAAYMSRFGFYRSKSSTGTVQTIDSRIAAGYVELLVADSPLFKWALKIAGQVMVLGMQVPMVSRDALVAMKVRSMLANPARNNDRPDIVSVLVRGAVDVKRFAKYLTQAELMEMKRLEAQHS